MAEVPTNLPGGRGEGTEKGEIIINSQEIRADSMLQATLFSCECVYVLFFIHAAVTLSRTMRVKFKLVL